MKWRNRAMEIICISYNQKNRNSFSDNWYAAVITPPIYKDYLKKTWGFLYILLDQQRKCNLTIRSLMFFFVFLLCVVCQFLFIFAWCCPIYITKHFRKGARIGESVIHWNFQYGIIRIHKIAECMIQADTAQIFWKRNIGIFMEKSR